MSTDEASCSDCKLELIEKRWTKLLLKWLNKCIAPKQKVKQLNLKSLVDVINKYKHDICTDDIDRALLCTDDLEPFIKYKYPILRLRNLFEDADQPKKIYIMTSVLLFYCCMNSQTGIVDSDICSKLDKEEQELILKFCESLSEMEITIYNVDTAIRSACEAIGLDIKSSTKLKKSSKKPRSNTGNGERCLSSSESTFRTSLMNMLSDVAVTSPKIQQLRSKKMPILKFKSSVTVLPSVVTDTSSSSLENITMDLSDCLSSFKSDETDYSDSKGLTVFNLENARKEDSGNAQEKPVKAQEPVKIQEDSSDAQKRCQPACSCSKCLPAGPCCGDPGGSKDDCDIVDNEKSSEEFSQQKPFNFRFNWMKYLSVVALVMLIILVVSLTAMPFLKARDEVNKSIEKVQRLIEVTGVYEYSQSSLNYTWQCKNNFCQKVYQIFDDTITFTSFSRCILLCMGPQLWPQPIGYTYFSKKIVTIATNKLEYKFQSIPSELVHQYLAEAFKLFVGDLAKLEKIDLKHERSLAEEFSIKKMSIQIDIETDADPRYRINTEEAYTLKIESDAAFVYIKLTSASFCGARHGLETLSQMILLDQNTGHLITLSHVIIKDAPSYRYRGLMIDTGRNFIPVADLMKTIDAMATCKLNTFHWRITDVASFPMFLEKVPYLFEYGAFDRSLVYTKDDIKSIVSRAGIRGIRILIEVAAPGPVGRAFSGTGGAGCPTRNENYTCDNILCLRLKMIDSVFDTLQDIYSEIIEMTKVDDIFHLSDSVFSLSNCYFLIDDREGFLDKALERLKIANKGFLPKLPVIWYTTHLTREYAAKTWEHYGVQLNEWLPNPSEQFLSKFKVIHSSKWDLSCETKKYRCRKYRTWQEMYAWKSWRNIEVFNIEGGEAVLWTDLVNSGNLDYHLWPRTAAVAERLWSDIIANRTATETVYCRLDTQRWRMLLKGVKVQPLWPVWCSINPGVCLQKLNKQ